MRILAMSPAERARYAAELGMEVRHGDVRQVTFDLGHDRAERGMP